MTQRDQEGAVEAFERGFRVVVNTFPSGHTRIVVMEKRLKNRIPQMRMCSNYCIEEGVMGVIEMPRASNVRKRSQ